MNKYLRGCLYQTMRKRIDESKLDIRRIQVAESSVSYFYLSSNLIISFCHAGKLYYFRECPPLLSAGAYLKRETERYFRTINQQHIHREHFKQALPINTSFSAEQVNVFRAYLDRLGQKPRFYRRLSQADRISERLGFSIWGGRILDRTLCGAYGLEALPESCLEIAIHYLWCMRGAARAYRTLFIARGRKHSFFSAAKSIATRTVADALDAGGLVTSAELCRVEFESGETMFGVLCDAAPGSRMVDSDIRPCGGLQRELMSLNLLDAICMQTDHGPNNYNVSAAQTVCAFDNDNPNTFLPIPTVKRSLPGCAALIGSDGLVNRPYVSRGLYDGICNAALDRLDRQLRPWLNTAQRVALRIRIMRLRSALKKTAAHNPDFLLEDDAWNDRTVSRELSGMYGNTYLTIASERQRQLP